MKTKNSIIAIASVLLLAACQETNKQENETGSADTAVLMDRDNDKSTVTINDMEAANKGTDAPAAWSWDGLEWESPIVKYDEVKDRDVEVRGNDQYGIYSLDENVLFDVDKSALKPTAKNHLDQIVTSIDKRYPNAHIGVFGFTDNTGAKDYNKELSEQRAESVKQYLVSTGKLDAARMTVEGYGEKRPAATNETAAGRAKNRRVQIVAKK